MFKSVFTKYMTIFMLIIIVSFTILATVISSLMQGYTNEKLIDSVYREADSIKAYLEVGYELYEGDSFEEYVLSQSDFINRSVAKMSEFDSNTVVFVTDVSGKILISTLKTEKNQIDSGTMSALITEGKLSQNGDLNGIFTEKQSIEAMTVSVNGNICGAVFTCASGSRLNGLTTVMVKTIIMASLWIALAVLIAVYFITERITVPLREMSRAAKSFAAGHFDVRVPVIGRDEVAELAVAFNNMAGSLDEIENTRRTFLANVSHDLRTPMFNISGFIESILSGAIPPDEQDKYLKIIAAEVKRLSRLVESLLDISRIQAGDRKFNKTPFDICEMARQIVLSFEQKIETKGLDVEFDLDGDRIFVLADKDAIYQILYNICDNAVKFSKDGGKYRVSVKIKDRHAVVSVYNEGQGISKDDITHIFDRFYKADKSRGLDKTGTGLGLFIAKTIIDAHNEKIWVKSEEGQYCEFSFTIIQSTEQAYKEYMTESMKKKKLCDAVKPDLIQ